MQYHGIFNRPKVADIDWTKEVDECVPNQSLSIKEILTRFTRGEALPVSKQTAFVESFGEDLEKVANADLVDKDKFRKKMIDVRRRYDKQENDKRMKEKADAEAKALEEARQELIKKRGLEFKPTADNTP